jgi:hypothetical protein
MAEGRTYVCNQCRFAVEAWSDGNPFYIDSGGAKRYAHHPQRDLSLCIGNDVPHLCLACGERFNVDSLAPIGQCPACASPELCDTFELDGRTCPKCKAGTFASDPDSFMVS